MRAAGLRKLRTAGIALSLLVLAVCGREPTSPPDGGGRIAGIAFSPVLSPAVRAELQAAGITIDNVHIVLRGADGAVVLDTIVAFPPGASSVTVTLPVTIHGESEHFTAGYELRSGDAVMFTGSVESTARPGETATAPATTQPTFVGPGATATRVTLAPNPSTLQPGGTVQLTASVTDAAGAPVPGALLSWASGDNTVATVSASGLVTAASRRGSTAISASVLLTTVSGSALVNVVLPPARIVVESGTGQTGPAGSTLPIPFGIQVQASDGIGSPGVAVTFSAITGNGASVGTGSAVTDASGRASTTLTLSRAIGASAYQATVAGLPAAQVSAAVTAGAASLLAIVSGDGQADTVGRGLPQAFAVKVTDAFGNVVSGATVTWARTAGSGTLSAASSTTDANGVAQVSYQLGTTPGTESVRASIAAGAAVTFTATAIARPARNIVATGGTPQAGTAGAAAPVPLAVRVTDAVGFPVGNVTVTWAGNGASLASAATTTDAAGTTSNTANFPQLAGAANVTATIPGGASASFALTANAGPPTQLIITAGNGQTAPAGTVLPIAPAVKVADQYGNAIASQSVTFAVTGGGGSVTGSPAPSNASGIATLGSWTLGPAAGPNTMTATLGAITTTFTATASAPVGSNTLSMTTQPSTPVANTAVFATQPQVQLRGPTGAPIATAGVPVTVALQTAGPALRGTLTVATNAAGLAIFTNLSVKGTVGTNALVFSAPSYTGVTSATFTITAGPAVTIAANANPASPAAVSSVATPNPQVLVTDSSANPVAGVSVTFAVSAPINGTVVGGAATTNAAGIAAPTSWTLGGTARPDTLTATSAGLSGSPVTWVVNATAGAATQIVKISGDNQVGTTGTPLPASMVVEVRDASNNVVTTGVIITYTVLTGGGGPSTLNVPSNGSGQAAYTLTLGPPGAQSVKACLPGCTASVTFNATSIPVGADAIWTGATSTAWTTAGNWNPAAVPSNASNVYIPLGTPNSPILSGNVTVNDLTIDNTASLNIGAFQLDVSGNLNAGTTITGAGTVRMTGAGRQLSGTIPSLLLNSGNTITAAGTVVINGNLTIHGNAVFAVGASTTTVTGSMGYFGGGYFTMTNAAGHLTVNGNFSSDQVDLGNTTLTAGLLEVKGNFTTNGSNYQNFRAMSGHITRFSGSSAQAINIYWNDLSTETQVTFGSVEFTGGNTVTLNSSFVVLGTAVVNNGTTLTGGGQLWIHGLLTTTAGTDLSTMNGVVVRGTGAVFPQFGGVASPLVQIAGSGTVTAPASVTLPGSMIITNNSSLDVGTSNIVVGGNFSYSGGGYFIMTNAAGHLTVNGNFSSDQVDLGNTTLTAGLLEVKGNFTTNGSNYQNFRAMSGHTTRFSGGSAQAINIYWNDLPGETQVTFGKVEFTGGNTVTLNSSFVVLGTALVNNNTVVTGGGQLWVHGLLSTTAGTNLSGMGGVVVRGTGAVFPQFGGSQPSLVELYSGGVVTAPATVTLPGALFITGSGTGLDVGASNITVGGNFSYNGGGYFTMTNAAGHLTVNGNFSSDQVDLGNTTLTAGLLEVKGNFTTNGSNYQNFRAMSGHITRFSGSSAQAINIYWNDLSTETQVTFGSVEFTGGNTVTLNSSFVVLGTAVVNNGTTLTGGGQLWIHGLLTTIAGTDLSTMNGVVVRGTGAVFPQFGGVASPLVQITSGGVVTAPASLTLPGSMVITGGGSALDVGASNIVVSGNFSYSGGGYFIMTNAAGHLTVNGNFSSDQVDLGNTTLTAGLLEVKGNFTTNGSNYQNFRAMSGHTTRFSGGSAQVINIYWNDVNTETQVTFGTVEFTGGNTVTLNNSFVVLGTGVVNNGTTLTGGGQLWIHGVLTTASGTDLSGMAGVVVRGTGAVFPQVGGAQPPFVQIASGGGVTAPASVSMPGSLVITGGSYLDVGASSITIGGNFSYYAGGYFRMTDPGGHLTVNGNFSSDQVDLGDGTLTAGLLEVKGNFTTNGSNYQNFRARGTHTTRFSGSAAQTVSIYWTDIATGTQVTFQNIEITNPSASGVMFVNGGYVWGNVTQGGHLAVSASQTLKIIGSLTLQSGSLTDAIGSIIRGSCTNLGGTITGAGLICP